jgi:branched-chain amino acid transport system permease protein
MRLLKIAGLLVLLAIIIAFPQVFTDPATDGVAIFALLFAVAATGWNIFAGYTGYIALGHGVYFGVGAYAMAILCQNWHISPGYNTFLIVPLGGLVAAVFSIPLGAIALRTRRHTFIVVTIATFFIFQLLAFNLTQFTNGSIGLNLPITSFVWNGYFVSYPFYYITLALLLLAIATSWWVRNSKFGLGLLAIRDDEDRALGLGVRTGPAKLVAFVISAFIVGMVGAIWAFDVQAISPSTAFDANFDVALALMAFSGGLGTISGPILGALVLESAQQYFTINYGASGYYLIIFGALLLLVVLLLPRGVIPTINDWWLKYRASRLRGQEEEGAVVVPLPVSGGSGTGGAENVEKKEGINL